MLLVLLEVFEAVKPLLRAEAIWATYPAGALLSLYSFLLTILWVTQPLFTRLLTLLLLLLLMHLAVEPLAIGLFTLYARF